MNEMDISFLMVTVCLSSEVHNCSSRKKKNLNSECHKFNKYKINTFYFSSAVLIIGVSRIFLGPSCKQAL